MRTKTKAGAPSYQLVSARSPQRRGVTIIQQRQRQPQRRGRVPLSQDFKAGLFLGFAAAALVCSAVLWLWAIPTVDGAVEQARQAASYSEAAS